jgi:hypothetical protein
MTKFNVILAGIFVVGVYLMVDSMSLPPWVSERSLDFTVGFLLAGFPFVSWVLAALDSRKERKERRERREAVARIRADVQKKQEEGVEVDKHLIDFFISAIYGDIDN